MTANALTPPNRLGWMLDEALEVPDTRFAVLFSGDGLRLAHSRHITVDDADPFAAAMSAVTSLMRNAAPFAGGDKSGWKQGVCEYEGGFLLLAAAGEGAYLGFSVTADADLMLIATRMRDLVQRLGKELSVAPRQPDDGARA